MTRRARSQNMFGAANTILPPPNMAGPNLEIFKFSLYLFVPIAALVHFGNPDWYQNHVVPVSLDGARRRRELR